MFTIMTKKQIINELKLTFGFKKNEDFAKALGIKPSAVTNWNRRDSMDYELIKKKFPSVDMNYLITEGKEGQLLKESPLDRVLKVFKILNINLDTVYEKSGIIPGSLEKASNTYENIAFNSLDKILLSFPQISREFILTGKGEMFVEKSEVNEDKAQYTKLNVMRVEIDEKLSEFDLAYNNLKNVISKYNLAL